jgi:hypothetical protein
MKKIIALLCLLGMIPVPHIFAETSGKTVCPKPQSLQDPAENDKEELKHALSHGLISKTYGRNPNYLDYEVEVMSPMKELTGTNKSYYHMAIQQCGKGAADRSWFVRLRFPKVHSMMALGEFFAAKNNENRWTIWFRYH